MAHVKQLAPGLECGLYVVFVSERNDRCVYIRVPAARDGITTRRRTHPKTRPSRVCDNLSPYTPLHPLAHARVRVGGTARLEFLLYAHVLLIGRVLGENASCLLT